MSEATLTSKGQITIPADIRRVMAIAAKDRITFTPMPDGTVVMRAKTKSMVDLKGLLKPLPGLTVTLAEMSLGAN
jgi:AbrB family looped-hinge helix DNA binding protein